MNADYELQGAIELSGFTGGNLLCLNASCYSPFWVKMKSQCYRDVKSPPIWG